MSRSLPDRPDLQHLRRQARRLHSQYTDAVGDALTRIRQAHPRLSGASDDQLIEARLTLQACQLVIAREYGFDSWPQLKAHIDSAQQPTYSVDELIEFFVAVQRPVPWTQEEHLRTEDIERVRQLLQRHPSLAHARIRTEVFSSKEEALRQALRAEPQPDPGNELTVTALHPLALGFFRGASPTDLALARLLLEAGADVDARGDMSQDGPEAPINYAAWEGGFEMLRLLLEHGVDVSGETGWGALKTAAGHGRIDCFDLLIEHGAPVTPELLIRAGLTQRVRALVDDEPERLTAVDEGGYTLLQRAAAGTDRWHGDPQAGHRLTRELIERGAEVDIFTATALDDADRVEAILRADPQAAQARLPDGATPVHFAANSGSAGTLALLLAAGADPDLSKEEQAPLKLAARLNDTAVCRLLLEHGATPTDMAMDSAAWNNKDPELIKLLLDHGGSPNPTEGPDDRVAIHWACRANPGAVRYLIDAGADVNTRMDGGREGTPLHDAVGNRDHGPEIIQMLLDAGADPTLTNRDGETPLAVAVSEGREGAAEVLRRWLTGAVGSRR